MGASIGPSQFEDNVVVQVPHLSTHMTYTTLDYFLSALDYDGLDQEFYCDSFDLDEFMSRLAVAIDDLWGDTDDDPEYVGFTDLSLEDQALVRFGTQVLTQLYLGKTFHGCTKVSYS